MPDPVRARHGTVVAPACMPTRAVTAEARERLEAGAGLAAVVLAAGGASRFGGPKLLARLKGVSLVRRVVRRAVGCCPAGVVVVTGAWAAAVEEELADLPVKLCRNPQWQAGLAGSLRCGLDALPRGTTASLILLGDQPLVDEDDLRRLVAAWAGAPGLVAAAAYGGIRGVPAIFPATHWAALRTLRGDCGARAVIAALPEVTAVELGHAACDIDTRDDLEAAGGE